MKVKRCNKCGTVNYLVHDEAGKQYLFGGWICRCSGPKDEVKTTSDYVLVVGDEVEQ